MTSFQEHLINRYPAESISTQGGLQPIGQPTRYENKKKNTEDFDEDLPLPPE